VAFRQHDAELVEQSPQLVGLHDAHLHELSAQAMQRQHDLLSLALDRNEPHAGLAARRPDRLRIRSVGLVPTHERPDHLRRQQAHVVAESQQLAAPLVSAPTGLHHHQRSLPVGQPRQHLRALELQSFDGPGVGFDPCSWKICLAMSIAMTLSSMTDPPVSG
jgi:hypothetical protein